MAHRPTDFEAGKLKPMAQRSGSRRHDDRAPWESARDRYAVERGGKRGRQLRAWARCAVKRETGAHIPVQNCTCCGCPAAEM